VLGTDYTSPYPTTFMGMPFGITDSLPSNAIENSSYTAILADAGSSVVDSWFVYDDVASDTPNRAGVPIAPAFSITDPAGFLPAGAYRTGSSLDLLNFNRPGGTAPTLNDGTLAGGTPGIYQINIPAPGAFAFAGMGGLLVARRRRA
jgi:hypothetical protein